MRESLQSAQHTAHTPQTLGVATACSDGPAYGAMSRPPTFPFIRCLEHRLRAWRPFDTVDTKVNRRHLLPCNAHLLVRSYRGKIIMQAAHGVAEIDYHSF